MDFDPTQYFSQLKSIPIIDVELGMRNLREKLLRDNVDTFNPIRYAALTTEQQQELAAYRQALLDITSQPGWPAEATFPAPPSFV